MSSPKIVNLNILQPKKLNSTITGGSGSTNNNNLNLNASKQQQQQNLNLKQNLLLEENDGNIANAGFVKLPPLFTLRNSNSNGNGSGYPNILQFPLSFSSTSSSSSSPSPASASFTEIGQSKPVAVTATMGNITKRGVQTMAKRNARERNRVKMVNQSFQTLRQHIPEKFRCKKMSKVDTLRCALEYIKKLAQVLDEEEQEEELPVPTHEFECSLNAVTSKTLCGNLQETPASPSASSSPVNRCNNISSHFGGRSLLFHYNNDNNNGQRNVLSIETDSKQSNGNATLALSLSSSSSSSSNSNSNNSSKFLSEEFVMGLSHNMDLDMDMDSRNSNCNNNSIDQVENNENNGELIKQQHSSIIASIVGTKHNANENFLM